MEMRRFTNNDWDGNAGCVNFTDGTWPLTGEVDAHLVIADGSGIGIYRYDLDDPGKDESYYWTAPEVWTPLMARVICESREFSDALTGGDVVPALRTLGFQIEG